MKKFLLIEVKKMNQTKKIKKIKKRKVTKNKVDSLQLVERIIYLSITVPIQLFQTIGVIIIANFNQAFIELIFFLLGFFFTKNYLGETFHLHSTVACTTVTWTMFYLITSFIPQIEISIFLSIFLGVMLGTYMNYVVTTDANINDLTKLSQKNS